ncbi:hypothetical protein R5R35_005816 [Gryllus longicercus]|uniref:PHD finger protein 20 n=1 Tax=Gryllus longicercus TaxID=2509291 RepID=A0AAN9VP07_9ORTH
MREYKVRGSDKNEQKIFKHTKKGNKPKDIKRRNVDKRAVNDEDTGSIVGELEADMRDSQCSARTCSSPVKSEYSEEGSGPELPGSFSFTGGNGTQSSGSSRNPFPPSSSKKQGISGIKFQPGTRLEAKDLGNGIWYAVKVVEVDWEEEEILIHFEKWSQRYDEWIPMDSSRLRPVMEPPGGSFVKKITKIFKVGDKVMATWSDSRKYPATVKTVLGSDKYEVLFFDGFSKNIKGGRMIPLKDEELAKIQELQPGIGPSNDVTNSPLSLAHSSSQMITTSMAATLGTKEERRERKRKLNVAELFHFKKRPRIDNPSVAACLENRKKAQRGGGFGSRGRKKGQWTEDMSGVDSSSIDVKIEKNPLGMSQEKKENVLADVLSVESKRRENIVKSRGKISKLDNNLTVKRTKSEMSGHRIDDEGKPISGKKIGRKMNKFKEGARRTHSATQSKRDKGLEDSDQRGRKKEDGDGSRPARAVDDWEPIGEPAYIVDGTDGPRKSIIVADPRIPPGWTRHTIQRMSGHSAGKWDVFFVCPEGRKFRTRHELRLYYEERGEIFPSEQFDFSLGRRKNKAAMEREGNSAMSSSSAGCISNNKTGRQAGVGSTPLNLGPSVESSGDTPVRRVKTLLPRIRPLNAEGGLPPSVLHGTPGNDPVEDLSLLSDGSVLGGLKIQKENDAFRCPKEGCNKNFRKENLLQMHMKHYHPEYNRFVASTPNVADLAYARTVGEPLEELHTRTPRPSVLDKISRFEALRRARATPGESVSSSPPVSSTLPLTSTAAAASASESSLPMSPLHSATPKSATGSLRRRLGEVEASDVSPLVETLDTGAPSGAMPRSPLITDHGEVPQTVIRTLVPVVRPLPVEMTLHLTSNEGEGDLIKGMGNAVLQNSLSSAETTSVLEKRLEEKELDTSSSTSVVPISNASHTKSLRMVRRRHMSDFHMEPLLKKRKSDAEETAQNAVVNGTGNRQTRTESLRREELINCTCGYPEEDGLMIQCDLCMCWQHGLCNNIEHEDHVPEKYVCYICQNPSRERRSKHFLHDQDWLKEGRLPSLSFRSKNPLQIAQNEAILKDSHDLTGTLLQLQTVIHSLRVKVNIAEKKDHPKLYLWAHSWEKGQNPSPPDLHVLSRNERKIDTAETSMKTEEQNEVETSKTKRNFSHQYTTVCNKYDAVEQSLEMCEAPVEVKLEVETKTNSPEVADTVVVDNTIEIATETEVVTAETVQEETEEQKERYVDEDDKLSSKSIQDSMSVCGNEEMSNSTVLSSPVKVNDKKANFNRDSNTEDNVSVCRDDFDESLSVGNTGNTKDASGAANGMVARKAVQSAPQPEAPIDPTECRLILLDHIEHGQQQVEERLALIETQLEELENMDTSSNIDRCSDSRIKETIQMLLRDLSALYDIATFN